MSRGDLGIGKAMSRGNADGPGTEFFVHGRSPANDLYVDRLAGKYDIKFFANEFFVTGIVRMHGYGDVTDLRLWSCRSNGNREVF